MTNKFKYFIGNWKMFGDIGSFKIVNKINQYAYKYSKSNKKKIILCVPNTLIHYYNKKLKKKHISLGAQNCHYNEKYGSFTGSVSALMLKRVGAQYVIIGHSENRSEGETNKLLKKKVTSAFNQKLNVIFCIGETFKDKKKGNTLSVIRKQMQESLNKKVNLKKIILAYEPVWAIGSNKIPKIKELSVIVNFIKKTFKKIFKSKKYPKVLYGGSVHPKNVGLFTSINEIDGFLIGVASQSSKKFIDIIKNYYK